MSAQDAAKQRMRDLLLYRKAALAVVAAYLQLGDDYLAAILSDQLDEFLSDHAQQRGRQRIRSPRRHARMLARECILRYAGTAAESLSAPADSEVHLVRIMGDTGGLGLIDDINVVLRVEEMLDTIEPISVSEETEAILMKAKRELCNYYNACAYELVRERLYASVIEVAEALFLRDVVDEEFVKASLIRHGDRLATAHRSP